MTQQRKTNKVHSDRLELRISPAFRELLMTAARRHGVTMAQFIRLAVTEKAVSDNVNT